MDTYTCIFRKILNGKMENFSISIIVPVYNVAQYVESCLQSVAAQKTKASIECIIVDDCGTDSSMEIVERYLYNYKGRITFHICHHDKNQGLSSARNTGIKAASGKYIYFLDSDDVITSDCLEGFSNICAKYPNVDIIQGMFSQESPYMKHFSSKKYKEYTDDRTYIKKALLDYNELPICAANKMIRKQLLVDNNLYFKEGIIHEDNYWSFFLAKHVRSLAVLTKECYIYTENPNSITKAVNVNKETLSYSTMIRDFSDNIDDFLSGEQKICILRLLNNAIDNHYYKSEEDKKVLFETLYKQCTLHEKIFLRLWQSINRSSKMSPAMFNVCQRLFRLSN